MALLPTSVDRTDKDFDALLDRMVQLVESVFPDWTDHDTLSLANLLVEAYCFVGDVVTFYQDGVGTESRWSTATQLRSVIALAKLIGYSVPGRQAATTTTTLYLDAAPANQVPIPVGTIVRNKTAGTPVRFRTTALVTIAAGADPAQVLNVTVENADPWTETFTSNDRTDQERVLGHTPYVDGSLAVSTSAGAWTRVDNFLLSAATDRHFVVLLDDNDRATVRFGDDRNGAIPRGTVTLTYKTGGGADGNVEAGALALVESTVTDVLGNVVALKSKDSAAASNGLDRDSVALTKVKAPAAVRAPRTTVAREDYEVHALLVTGVARTLMLTSDQKPNITENHGFLYVVPSDFGTPSPTLLAAVKTMVTVTYPNTVTFSLDVLAAPYLIVNVSVRAYRAAGTTLVDLTARVQTALEAYFALLNEDGEPNTNVDFGFNYKDADGVPAGEVPWSDVFNVVRDVAGMRKLDAEDGVLINGVAEDLSIDKEEFPKLGTVTVIDAEAP